MANDKNIHRKFRVRTVDYRHCGAGDVPGISEQHTTSLQTFLWQAKAATHQVAGGEIASERTCTDVFLFATDHQRRRVGEHYGRTSRQRLAIDTGGRCVEHLESKGRLVEANMVRYFVGLCESIFSEQTETSPPAMVSNADLAAFRRQLNQAAGTDAFTDCYNTALETVKGWHENRQRFGLLELEGQLLIHKKRVAKR